MDGVILVVKKRSADTNERILVFILALNSYDIKMDRLLFIPDTFTTFSAGSAGAMSVTWLYITIEGASANMKTCADDLIHFELFHAELWGCVEFLFHCRCCDYKIDSFIGVEINKKRVQIYNINLYLPNFRVFFYCNRVNLCKYSMILMFCLHFF